MRPVPARAAPAGPAAGQRAGRVGWGRGARGRCRGGPGGGGRSATAAAGRLVASPPARSAISRRCTASVMAPLAASRSRNAAIAWWGSISAEAGGAADPAGAGGGVARRRVDDPAGPVRAVPPAAVVLLPGIGVPPLGGDHVVTVRPPIAFRKVRMAPRHGHVGDGGRDRGPVRAGLGEAHTGRERGGASMHVRRRRSPSGHHHDPPPRPTVPPPGPVAGPAAPGRRALFWTALGPADRWGGPAARGFGGLVADTTSPTTTRVVDVPASRQVELDRRRHLHDLRRDAGATSVPSPRRT